MLDRLGWSLPLDLFLDWINGRPSARAPVRNRVIDAQSRLKGFEQLGWHVYYNRLGDFPPGVPPAQVTAEKSGSRVNLIISEALQHLVSTRLAKGACLTAVASKSTIAPAADGVSPSGKAPGFDPGTRRFESCHPSQKRVH